MLQLGGVWVAWPPPDLRCDRRCASCVVARGWFARHVADRAGTSLTLHHTLTSRCDTIATPLRPDPGVIKPPRCHVPLHLVGEGLHGPKGHLEGAVGRNPCSRQGGEPCKHGADTAGHCGQPRASEPSTRCSSAATNSVSSTTRLGSRTATRPASRPLWL